MHMDVDVKVERGRWFVLTGAFVVVNYITHMVSSKLLLLLMTDVIPSVH